MNRFAFIRKIKRPIQIAILLICGVAIFAYALFRQYHNRTVEYADVFDEPAYWIDDEPINFSALGFYILHYEREVEETALLYNKGSTNDYWNIHTNDTFIREDTKKAIMQAAIHDELYYREAMKLEFKLTAEEERSLQNSIADFWMDLLDEQQENRIIGDEYLVESMTKLAYADKYMTYLSEESGEEVAQYAWDGYLYKQWLEDQSVRTNDYLWDKITVGEISIHHEKTNFVNGNNGDDDED